MLALIETCGGKKTVFEPLRVFGMRCARVRIASGRSGAPAAGAANEAAKQLEKSGIFRLCFEKDFACREVFLRRSFVSAQPEIFRAAAAGKALRAAGGRCAALFAPQLTPACQRALLELCAGFQRVMLKLDSGGEDVCAALERLAGVSAVNDPSPKALLQADAALFFSRPVKPVRLSNVCCAYSVRRDFPDNVRCRRIIERAVPQYALPQELAGRYDAEELLSEALLSGAIKEDELEIVSLKRLDSSRLAPYN